MALEAVTAQLGVDGGKAGRGTLMAQELVTGTERVEGLKERVAAYERRLIREALWTAGGNQRRAAAALGCLPTTLNEKMRRLGLRGQNHSPRPEPLSTGIFAMEPEGAFYHQN